MKMEASPCVQVSQTTPKWHYGIYYYGMRGQDIMQ